MTDNSRLVEPMACENGQSLNDTGVKQTQPDLSKEKTLYCVPYAHLDTQWRWDYVTTIDRYIKATLHDNFALLEKYPEYQFTFTGSVRYAMMKEYYPEEFERLKGYVKQGRWHVGGSSVDEGDANVPSPESVIRQVLYGNAWFKKEFGVESVDYMLPDCFGFPASMPSVLAHCGLRGFSTQKLTWGCAVGIPFSLGVWIGPDGRGVICAFDPGDYGAGVPARLDLDPKWVKRVNENGEKHGVFADYRYFGVGDQGGAPRECDVAMTVGSAHSADSEIRVIMASSDQLFRDITDEQAASLPTYTGDLLLKEHSAGSITSQAYMKRWNRKNEILADSAERAAVAADWLGLQQYPRERFNAAWGRVLASQFHDILPGTSVPKAYEYSWNDEVIALNIFAQSLEKSAGAVIRNMDTQVEGVPVVVYNPLAIERCDVVEASIEYSGTAPDNVEVTHGGETVPCQIIERRGNTLRMLFLATVGPVGYSVFGVRPCPVGSRGADSHTTALKVTSNALENEHYTVTIDESGDVSSILDKRLGKEILSGPVQLQFLHEAPAEFPAWNMDWEDRQKPPMGIVDGPAEMRVIENGPVRVAIEVSRSANNSVFTQQIRLSLGDAGRRVEFKSFIDWQSTGCSLKAAFPLAAGNSVANYNLGLGTVQRPSNHPAQYEVPSREWFDLTDADGSHGVSILEDCKFGSDKPDNHTLRLTLLHSPEVPGEYYKDQYSQDWGRHDITYALYSHEGSWADALTEWQARRLNQPLVAFQAGRHPGALGRQISLVSTSSTQIDVRALKKAEDSDLYIVRIQELLGRTTGEVAISFAVPVLEAYEVNGQESRIADAEIQGGRLFTEMGSYQIRSFAVRLQAPMQSLKPTRSWPVRLDFNADVLSKDSNRADGGFDSDGRTIPSEELPAAIRCDGVDFRLGGGHAGESNAVRCEGQTVDLPGSGNAVYLLAAANEKTEVEFKTGEATHVLSIPAWTGLIGQYDNRVWDEPFDEVDHVGKSRVVDITPGYIQRDPVGWFCTHRHHADMGNEAYQFCYLFIKRIPLTPGANTLTLPDAPGVKILAISAADDCLDDFRPAQALYDDFSNRGHLSLRK